MEEIWKDITGYEGYYQVSTFGNVKSVDRVIIRHLADGTCQQVRRRGKLLEKCPTTGGHLCVTLAKDNYNNVVQIRHIMAQEFLGNVERLPLMTYLDSDPNNLYLSNLQFIAFEDLPGEAWRYIHDFEGTYEVSNKGRIRSCERTFTYRREGKQCQGFRNSILIKTSTSEDGYENVQLGKDGKTYYFSVHRLVAEAFIPNPDNKPEVNHVDGVRNHNEDTNLEWCTCKENINDAISKRGRANLISSIRAAQGKKIKCLDNGVIFASVGEAAKSLGRRDGAGLIDSIKRNTCYLGWTFVYLKDLSNIDESLYLIDARNKYYSWPRAKKEEMTI